MLDSEPSPTGPTFTRRMVLGLYAILLVGGALLALESHLHRKVRAEIVGLRDQTFQVIQALQELEGDGMALVSSTHEMLLVDRLYGPRGASEDPSAQFISAQTAEAQDRERALKGLLAHIGEYGLLVRDHFPDERNLFTELNEVTQQLIHVSNLVLLEPMVREDIGRPRSNRETFERAEHAFRATLETAAQREQEEFAERINELDRLLTLTRVAIWGGFALAIATTLLVGRWLVAATVPQMDELNRALADIGRGDLTRRARVFEQGELGRVAGALNNTIEQLQRAKQEHDDVAEELRRLNEQANALVEARTKELQRVKDRSEGASKAKSRFLESISHEFRTPLTAVVGYADLLRLLHGSDENVSAISDAAHDLIALVDSAIALSSFDDDAVHIDLSPVYLDDVIASVLSEVALLAKRQGVRVLRGERSSATVLSNPQHLRTVLLNIVTNGIIYNREGGTVNVSAIRTPDGTVTIQVADTGLGFVEDYEGQALEAFERLGHFASATRGMGVGLTIADKFIQAMEGELTYESTVGTGSWFRVTLREV